MTLKQTERLANIFDNAGQVFLAVVVLSPLIQGGITMVNPQVVISGIIVVLVCWITSLLLSSRGGRRR